MEIRIINNEPLRREWNKFLFENNGSFLQSFEWGKFQQSLGKQIWRIQVIDRQIVLAQALLIEEAFPLRRKSCLYIPFGPIIRKKSLPEEQKEVIASILRQIQNIAQEQGAIFLKIEPHTELILPDGLNAVIPDKRIQPQKTLILDLLQEEDEIFKNFSSKTRYNVGLAQRKGVKIKFEEQYRKEFYHLIKGTSERDSFTPFKEEHYKKLFEISSDDFGVKLCLADYNNKIVASYILILFNKTAIGLHGANDWQYRSLKAANLLQWERIKMVKNLGYEKFDFWGIDEKKWQGITDFKKGFGGTGFEYPCSKDIVFQKAWYKLYSIARRVI
ncbi:peptidoglycan bridge formation glycyltransferase FemA/FemB family protein [Patescibacteria group bacterium]|nr:peptidoglycan bridge formation glycyltransferase FemA/FemB family protein [Patescibacteria group bacterium]MBU4162207.1 peptidoglycan bridge formation glycyltransferase FemA/FemB family protein [Patescibacteria group bacterium]